jgi:hypothetical protein
LKLKGKRNFFFWIIFIKKKEKKKENLVLLKMSKVLLVSIVALLGMGLLMTQFSSVE